MGVLIKVIIIMEGFMRRIIRMVKRASLSELSHTLHKRTSGNQKGQSTAEFILTFGFVVLIVIVFIQMSLNLTKGYLVHYATFMASRSFLVQDNNSATPVNTDINARTISRDQVFKRIMPDFKNNNITYNMSNSVENKVFFN